MGAETPMDTSDVEPRSQEEEAQATPKVNLLEDLKKNVALLERAVHTNQLRLIGRVLRNNTHIRKNVPPSMLVEVVQQQFAPDGASGVRDRLLKVLQELPEPETPSLSSSSSAMEVDQPAAPAVGAARSPKPLHLPETEVYLGLLGVTSALRANRDDLAREFVTSLLEFVRQHNRRTLDALGAKVVFYLAYVHEKAGKLTELRPLFVRLHRTACLHHDEIGQATVLNMLLRSLVQSKLIEQAANLVARTNYPEGASNNQLCRYLYYVGRIQAIQLDYSEAYAKLQQAARKAPQDTALGFRRAVHKLLVIVQLLMGDIPERSVFVQPGLHRALYPYLNLTMAVRRGDLLEFNKVIETNAGVFKADETYTLILRLAHNVIKTGLRKISLSYSRISLADIAAKLHLESTTSAEFVCAKAIKDGVIEAVLDHEQGFLQSRDITDVYATTEPQQAYHKRITFCLDIHNEAVRSMRFPATSYKDLPSTGDRDEKTEEELAKELETELDEGF